MPVYQFYNTINNIIYLHCVLSSIIGNCNSQKTPSSCLTIQQTTLMPVSTGNFSSTDPDVQSKVFSLKNGPWMIVQTLGQLEKHVIGN